MYNSHTQLYFIRYIRL